MSAWLKRFGLHLAAAVGATGVFVAAAAVGANQTRQQSPLISPDTTIVARPTRTARPRPVVEVTPTSTPASEQQPAVAAGPPSSVSAAQPTTSAPPPTTEPPSASSEGSAPATNPPPANAPPVSKPAGQTAPSGQSAPAGQGAPAPRPTATPAERPERSLAGTVQSVEGGVLQVVGVGGRTWRVEPAPGALIRLNGKAAKLDALQPGDGVVILGQAQPGPGLRFLAHAITAKSR